MGRVHDDHICLGHVRHHLICRDLLRALAALLFDMGVALGVLGLVLNFLSRHAVFANMLGMLPKIVHCADRQCHGDDDE